MKKLYIIVAVANSLLFATSIKAREVTNLQDEIIYVKLADAEGDVDLFPRESIGKVVEMDTSIDLYPGYLVTLIEPIDYKVHGALAACVISSPPYFRESIMKSPKGFYGNTFPLIPPNVVCRMDFIFKNEDGKYVRLDGGAKAHFDRVNKHGEPFLIKPN